MLLFFSKKKKKKHTPLTLWGMICHCYSVLAHLHLKTWSFWILIKQLGASQEEGERRGGGGGLALAKGTTLNYVLLCCFSAWSSAVTGDCGDEWKSRANILILLISSC